MIVRTVALLVAVALADGPARSLAEDPKPASKKPAAVGPGSLLVVDAAGKEQTVRDYRFTAGVRRLGWLDPASGKGPNALMIRDDRKINFLEGVVTLVPLDRVRSVRFDADEQTMTVSVAGARGDADVSLTGSTKYKGINKLTIQAEVDKGDAGIATVTYQGGTLRGGIRAILFPPARAEVAKPGRPAVVVSLDDEVRKVHKVADLQALYRLPSGEEKLLPTVMFKKTLKLDLGKIQSVQVTPGDDREKVWQVITRGGDESALTPLGSLPVGGKTATLVGFIGRVPAGFKLFPLRRIGSITFDTTEEPKEKETGKKGE